MKDSERPWASPALLVLCLTVPALLVAWAVSRPLTYSLPPHLAPQAHVEVSATDDSRKLQLRLETLEAREVVLRDAMAQQQQTALLGLGIVTLLLTTVGLLLPVITYLTSILPGQKVVEEAKQLMKDGLDARFAELVEKQRNERIGAALEALKSDDPVQQQTGALYFTLNQHDPLTAQQLFELTAIFTKCDVALQNQLAASLIFRDSPYVGPALFSMLARPTNVTLALNYAIQHCRLRSAIGLRADLKEWALQKDNRQFVPTIFTWTAAAAPDFMTELLNDEAWLRQLPRMTQFQIASYLQASTRPLAAAGTALARILQGTIHTPVTATLQDCELEKAQAILEHEDGVLKRRVDRGSPQFAQLATSLSAGNSA